MVIYMKFINGFNKEEIIIKNSRFISFAYYVESIDDIKDIINKLSIEYKDYTHLVYAYKFGMHEKAIDDGEPGGTAGAPILEVIKKNDLTNILIVVIRYFGGIKLGAGGLVRAYTKSITNTLSKDNISVLIPGYNIDIIFNYNQVKEIDYLLRDIKINNKIFDTNIIYNINIPSTFLDTIINNKIQYTIIKEIYLEI